MRPAPPTRPGGKGRRRAGASTSRPCPFVRTAIRESPRAGEGLAKRRVPGAVARGDDHAPGSEVVPGRARHTDERRVHELQPAAGARTLPVRNPGTVPTLVVGAVPKPRVGDAEETRGYAQGRLKVAVRPRPAEFAGLAAQDLETVPALELGRPCRRPRGEANVIDAEPGAAAVRRSPVGEDLRAQERARRVNGRGRCGGNFQRGRALR